MSEASAVAIPAPESPPTELSLVPEAKASLKTKILTAAGLGALGVAAFYGEKYLNGWPHPFQSGKHAWIGYCTAWALSRNKWRPAAVSTAASIGANAGAESTQDFFNSANHYPFHWAEIHNQQKVEGNVENAVDLAVCLGGTALFLAQNGRVGHWARQKFSALSGRFFGRNPEPVLHPVE